MLHKTKLFSSQFVIEKSQDQEFWSLVNKTEDIDKQINEWVDVTKSNIVNLSPPTMHAEWLDNTYAKKVIILSIVVIYAPTEEDNVGRYPEYKATGSEFV